MGFWKVSVWLAVQGGLGHSVQIQSVSDSSCAWRVRSGFKNQGLGLAR